MTDSTDASSGNWPSSNINTEQKQCALCKTELPEFNKEGKHNFAPHILEGEIKNICMKCKMLFVTSSISWTPRAVH